MISLFLGFALLTPTMTARWISKSFPNFWALIRPRHMCTLITLPSGLMMYRQRLFSLLDVNDSGSVEFSEFLIGMSIISDGIDDDQLISLAFKSIDYNSALLYYYSSLHDLDDGSLEIAEIANVLSAYSPLTSQEIQVIFNKIDTDKDGHVTIRTLLFILLCFFGSNRLQASFRSS